jgi:hypothetical protein
MNLASRFPQGVLRFHLPVREKQHSRQVGFWASFREELLRLGRTVRIPKAGWPFNANSFLDIDPKRRV